MSATVYEVLPNFLGFYVVEHTPEGYIIPRGWTYPSEAMAKAAIPYVAAGIHYPRIIESRAAGGEQYCFADPAPAERT